MKVCRNLHLRVYEFAYTVFQFLRRALVLRRAFSTLHSGATDVSERTGGRVMARTRERKRKREFLALLNWSAESCELSSCWERILFLFYSLRAAKAENSVRTSRLFENELFPVRQTMTEILDGKLATLLGFLFLKNFVDYIIPRIRELRD